MRWFRSLTQCAGRFLAGCLLAASLLPALAPAVAAEMADHPAAADAALHAVCTALGVKWVDDSGQEISLENSTVGSMVSIMDHCPMCLIGHTCGAPAPDHRPLHKAEPLPHAMPAAWWHAPRTAAVWQHARSRAPPSRS